MQIAAEPCQSCFVPTMNDMAGLKAWRTLAVYDSKPVSHLGGCVVRLPCVARDPDDRGDVDDATRPLLGHHLRRCLTEHASHGAHQYRLSLHEPLSSSAVHSAPVCVTARYLHNLGCLSWQRGWAQLSGEACGEAVLSCQPADPRTHATGRDGTRDHVERIFGLRMDVRAGPGWRRRRR